MPNILIARCLAVLSALSMPVTALGQAPVAATRLEDVARGRARCEITEGLLVPEPGR